VQTRKVSTDQIAPPDSWYSHGIVAGGLLFISGQGPFTPSGRQVTESFRKQCEQALSNVAAVAQAAGGSLDDAVRVGVYLRTMSAFDELNDVYREFFSEPYPARTTIETNLPGFDIEVDAVIALRDRS
jgi:2-iminobutanoate/2-iminopropanoate deaminase